MNSYKSILDFIRINIKTRVIYGLIYGAAVTLCTFFADFIFDLSDLGWDYYLASFLGMSIFGFFFAGIALKKNF
ncbi:MAG: hypothetical protein ABF274_11475 [Nonlabens sp.]|uniref:hypothetical protein n=1 Tax=Nonlabens sp. TaxID=1888209 RepID=UPI00321B6CAB